MVKVTAERIPDSQVLLNIEVEPERIEKSVERAYRKLVGRINIPGFRRGKAPRHIVERYVGRDALLQQGLEQLLSEVYRDAVQELDLHPIDQPDLDLEPKAENLKPGDVLVVKATVPVRPTVELGDYRAIRVTPVDVRVTAQEVNRIIDEIQEQQTEWVPVEHQVREGDRVVMDVDAQVGAYARLYSVSGEPLLQSSGGRTIVDEKKTEFEVDTEGSRYPKGFLDQLIGTVAGQEKHFELSLPVDYQDPDLANKLALYRVKVHEVKRKRVPPVDDDLARSAGYANLQQMRENLQRRAQARAIGEARGIYEQTVIQEAVAISTVEAPPTLVNRQIDHLLEHAKENLKRQRLELNEYLRMTRKSEAELREEFREQAVRNVKAALVLERIAEQEGMEVSSEEVDREIEALGLLASNQADQARQTVVVPEQREAVEQRIRHRKAVQLLLRIARFGGTAAAEPVAASEATEADAALTKDGEAAEAPPQGADAPEAPTAEPDGIEFVVEDATVEFGPALTELDKE